MYPTQQKNPNHGLRATSRAQQAAKPTKEMPISTRGAACTAGMQRYPPADPGGRERGYGQGPAHISRSQAA